MPRLNDAGQATPQVGYWWFDQSRWIFQDCDSGTCRIALSDGTLIAPMPCVRLIANGYRVWAFVEYVKGQDPTQATYRDSFGRVLVNAYPVAIGPDGAICVKPHSNIGARVLEPDGREWILSDDDAQDVQLLGRGRALFTVRGVPQANVPLIGNPGEPVWWARVTDDGLLLYQSQQTGELVLGGKVIGPPSANYFSPDVRLIDGVYVVCWSPSQNDTNAQFLRLTPAQLAALPNFATLPVRRRCRHRFPFHNRSRSLFLWHSLIRLLSKRRSNASARNSRLPRLAIRRWARSSTTRPCSSSTSGCTSGRARRPRRRRVSRAPSAGTCCATCRRATTSAGGRTCSAPRARASPRHRRRTGGVRPTIAGRSCRPRRRFRRHRRRRPMAISRRRWRRCVRRLRALKRGSGGRYERHEEEAGILVAPWCCARRVRRAASLQGSAVTFGVIGAVNPYFPLGGIRGEFELSGNGRYLKLLAPFAFEDAGVRVIVPELFVTDFNSVPRPLWVWFPPWECPEAAIVHDWLYRYPDGRSRADVDAIHRRIMEIKGERKSKRIAVWLGIRSGGWVAWNGHRKAQQRIGDGVV